MANLKEYSAYVATIGGLTVASPFFQVISINESTDSLYMLSFVYGHEAGHSLVIKNSSLPSMVRMMAGMYLGEGRIINETGCDIIGKAAAEKFMQNHLDDKELVDRFRQGAVDEEKRKALSSGIINNALKMQEKSDGSLNAYVSRLEAERKAKGVVHYTMNTARMSVMQTYSGADEVRQKLEFLYGRLGMKEYIHVLSRSWCLEKLDEFYKEYKEK